MAKKSGGLNKKMYQLLLEYLKDSDRSDGEIAKIIGVSQPTVSRMKAKLLKEGYISHFSAFPDFGKMGYEIMAFNFVRFNLDMVQEIEANTLEWVAKHPCIIFSSRAEGMGIDAVSVSMHKTYADFRRFVNINRERWGKFMEKSHHVLVDMKSEFKKPYSFCYLADCEE
ncbi:MAG TPA: Lrp/AsnC family transcriptional regulator [Candidatus Bathyarchaeota archaeon]|nr:Lrp/AsnC family transcriptional regulator [Candidatus Bathyarchaeota archaeon]